MKKQRTTIQRIWDSIKPAALSKNAIGDSLRNLPLFNRGVPMTSRDLGAPLLMEKEDNYRGYMFAAIRTRANRVAQLATDHLETEWAKDEEKEDLHPYLGLIKSSPTFSNYFFWKALSTFIDLKGAAYVLAVRNFSPGGKYGEIQEFKILNPYDIHRVLNTSTGEIGGYVETRYGLQRTIPPQMVLEFRELDPFNLDEGFSMAEAAAEDQFLNQQAGSYTRHALKNNVGQRGLLTTDVLLNDEEFINFKSGVEASAGMNGAGKFLYGNGAGALSYVDMQIDMDKLALDKINEISREKLFAVAGTSKTVMGIEQSGVTRETSKSQQDLFMQNQTMPQTQLIIDVLNQDYRNNYAEEFAKDPAEICIDSPLKVDREAELTDANIMKVKAETVKVFVDAGFDPKESLDSVGLPPMLFNAPAQPQANTTTVNVHNHDDCHGLNLNEFNESLRPIVNAKESTLQTDINNLQGRIVQASLKRITKNGLSQDQEDAVINKGDREDLEKELVLILAAFYASMIPLFAGQTTKQRFKEFGMASMFTMNAEVRKFIAERSKLSAESHMDTVLQEIYRIAQEAAKQGKGRSETVSAIVEGYNGTISQGQAVRIARTETNRSIAQAQFEADRQFVAQNGLEGRVYKRWIVRSNNPCPFCLKLQAQTAANPIPFEGNFVDLGGSVDAEFRNEDSTTTRSFVAGYEPIGSGTLHPYCNCIYELIIKAA